MKSERRHELQRNALADWLLQTRDHIQPYMNAILLGVIVVLLGVLAYTWMSRQSADREALAWDAVFVGMNGSDVSGLEDVVDQYPNTVAAQWAAVVAGDLRLNEGCESLLDTRETATQELQKAQTLYERVLESCREPVIRERATYGLARFYEAMAGTRQSQEDLKLAAENYEKIVTDWPDGAYAESAASRLEALNQDSTKAFYDKLAQWERESFTPPTGLDNMNIPFDATGSGLDVGAEPKYFGDLRERVDESLDDAAKPDDGEQPADTTGDADAPAMPAATGDAPAAGDEAENAATEEPATAAETPAATEGAPAEEPAASEEPAAEKPADNGSE